MFVFCFKFHQYYYPHHHNYHSTIIITICTFFCHRRYTLFFEVQKKRNEMPKMWGRGEGLIWAMPENRHAFLGRSSLRPICHSNEDSRPIHIQSTNPYPIHKSNAKLLQICQSITHLLICKTIANPPIHCKSSDPMIILTNRPTRLCSANPWPIPLSNGNPIPICQSLTNPPA